MRGGALSSSDEEEEGDEEAGEEAQETDEEAEDDNTFYSALEDGDDVDSGSSFQPGAIVRVTVTDFLTYENAEFIPGPHLNLVVGPNGTGKSSLVCAICLGLGYPPSVLGRASSVAEFVKHGKDIAFVEVELRKRAKDKGNFVVKLRIKRSDNSRKFWLNDKTHTHKSIQKLMRILRIQVDNLCQVLPQDKVAEFAGLSPVDLLSKTLQAAAKEEMAVKHAKLKEQHGHRKDIQQQLVSDKEKLRIMETRQQALQPDMERIRERQEIEQTIADLEIVRVAVVYLTARKVHGETKHQMKSATTRYRRLEKDCEPSLQSVNRKQDYQHAIERVVAEREAALKDAEETADRLLNGAVLLEQQLVQMRDQKEAEHTGNQAKRAEVGRLRQKITTLEAELKRDHKEFIAAEWNTKIREQEHQRRELGTERQDNRQMQERVKRQGREIDAQSRQVDRSLESLDSREGQQLSLLRKLAPDVARGVQWLEEHRNEFEKEIFGPPMITCAVRDKKYSDLVQSMLQNDDFLCFTTQSRNDHRKLSDQFYKTMSLSVTIRTCTTPRASFHPPLTSQQLSALQLDGFAVDFLEGPEPVLAMLCAERRLHSSAVGLKETSEEQFNQIVNDDKLGVWAAGTQSYRVTRRREYGPGAVSTATRDVRPGRYWTDQPTDGGEKAELRMRKAELSEQLEDLKGQMKVLRDENASLTARDDEVLTKIVSCRLFRQLAPISNDREG